MNVYRFTVVCLLAIVIISSTRLNEVTFADSVSLDIRAAPYPLINGVIGGSEFPFQLVNQSTLRVYASENGTYVFFAATAQDSTQNATRDSMSMVFDIGHERTQTLMTDDVSFVIFRNGTICYYYGIITKWSRIDVPEGVVLSVNSSSQSWLFEIAIPYDVLSLLRGQNKNIGFAFFQNDAGSVAQVFPQNASSISPATWTTLASSASWGIPDLSLWVSVNTLYPKTNQSVVFTVNYMNEGDSPVSNMSIKMSIDDQVVLTREDNTTLTPAAHRSMTFLWNATFGSHKIRFQVYSSGFDATITNNSWERIFEVSNLSLSVYGPEGSTISVDGYGATVVDGKATFLVPVGNRRIECPQVLPTIFGSQLRFVRWVSNDREFSRNSSITVLAENDLSFRVEYEYWHQASINFVDSLYRGLSAENYTVVFGNTSSVVLIEPSLWVRQGESFRITKAFWEGLDVIDQEKFQGRFENPITIQVVLKIYDISLTFTDPLGLPVGNAKTSVVFENGTVVVLQTDNSGVIRLTSVPLGRIHGNITSLGYVQDFSADSSQTASTKIGVKFSLYTLLLFIAPVVAIAVLVLVLKIRKGAKTSVKSKKEREMPTFGL
jgi:hypothetical protein